MAITLKPVTATTFTTKPPMTVGTGSKSMVKPVTSTIPKPATGKTDPQLLAQIEARIAEVRATQKSAIAQLEGKFLGGAPAAAAAASIRGLTARIDDWAKRGTDAYRTGTTPNGKGWPAWIDAGEVILSGMQDIAGFGLDANLDLIKETAANVPAEAVKTVNTIAKKTAEVVQATADVAAGAASSLIRPLLLPLGLLAVGLVAFLVIKNRGGA